MSAQSIAIPAGRGGRIVAVGGRQQDLPGHVRRRGRQRGHVRVQGVDRGSPAGRPATRRVARAFRYDPALENDGWHNSTKFPAAEDNPLNGNMYRPIYFHRGQAIHGANNVPPEPASKGCVRLRPENQDALVAWLGLDDVDGPTYNRDRINLAVSVHGEYQPT